MIIINGQDNTIILLTIDKCYPDGNRTRRPPQHNIGIPFRSCRSDTPYYLSNQPGFWLGDESFIYRRARRPAVNRIGNSPLQNSTTIILLRKSVPIKAGPGHNQVCEYRRNYDQIIITTFAPYPPRAHNQTKIR